MDEFLTLIVSRANFWITIALMMVGLYAMIAKRNLVKKVIGMNILQTSVILFFISMGAKRNATIPIAQHEPGASDHALRAIDYINPLPHVLMLTAIVVAVATLGVSLALVIRIFRQYGSLEEDQIIRQIQNEQGEEDHAQPG